MSKNLRSLVLAYRNIQHSCSQDRWRYNIMIYHNMINCGPRMAFVVGSATEIKGRGGLGAEVAERNWGSRYGASRRWMLAAWQSRPEGQGIVLVTIPLFFVSSPPTKHPTMGNHSDTEGSADATQQNSSPTPNPDPAVESPPDNPQPESAESELVGLGIQNGSAIKELPPSPGRDDFHSSEAIHEAPLNPEDIPVSPPLPPPKPERAIPTRTNSKETLEDVELSRENTPSAAKGGDLAFRGGVNVSHTSLPSIVAPSLPPTPSRQQAGARPPSAVQEHRSRRSSTATTLSLSNFGPNSPGPQLSTVLITPPLQLLVSSKEAKKSPSFHAAAQRALDLCQSNEGTNAAYLHPREIFEPLRLAISNPQTTSVPILVTSLDLLSKLISHSFFAEPHGPPPGLPPLPDLITHTIILSYSESSPPQVALQVVKALMAIVLSTDKGMLVHQSSLLKAVRTVYNVFLLSNDAANQVVAQGGLTQMVHHVFGRVIRPDMKNAAPESGRGSVSENEARRRSEVMQEGTTARSLPSTPVPEGHDGANGKMTL